MSEHSKELENISFLDRTAKGASSQETLGQETLSDKACISLAG